ncbi:MAG TPA: AI-2E family transporter [Polyangiales bacterium]|nr:AI-2E family transporter [Polyangiales bacterium]
METTPKSPLTLRVELDVRTVLVAVASVAGVWLAMRLWAVALVVLCALMIAGAFAPSIERLEKRGIRRPWAIAIVYVTLLLAAIGFCAATLPTLFDQVIHLMSRLPDTKNEIATQLENLRLGPFARSLRQVRVTELATEAQHLAIAYSSEIVVAVAYLLSTVFLALYLLIDRDRIRGSVFAMIPRPYHVRISRIVIELENIVGGYVRAQAICSVLLMVFTFSVLTVARVPNALALTLFAGIADMLPYVGAFLVCIPAALAALPVGTTPALIVLAVLAAYQEFESRYILPRVYGKALRLPAALVMIALLVGFKLLGVLGAILSLPTAAGIRAAMRELRFSFPGDDIDDLRARERAAALERDFAARAAGTRAAEAAAIASEIAARAAERSDTNPSLAPTRSDPNGSRP